jgi:hypothetical protein
MAASFNLREAGRNIALTDVSGQLVPAVERDGGRRAIWLSVQILARLDGQQAVFWLKRQGPVQGERLACQQRLVESDAGGFYAYEHAAIENLAYVAYRTDQATWRFVAVGDLSGAGESGQRVEIDLDLAVAAQIDWKC